MFPFGTPQSPFGNLPPILSNPLLTLSMISAQNRPLQNRPNQPNNNNIPGPQTLPNVNQAIHNEFLQRYFARIEKIAEDVINNPVLRGGKKTADSFKKYDEVRKSIKTEVDQKSSGFTMVQKSLVPFPNIKLEDESRETPLEKIRIEKPEETFPLKQKTKPVQNRSKTPRGRRPKTNVQNQRLEKSIEPVKQKPVKQQPLEPEISEEEAVKEINSRYLAKGPESEEPVLLDFTRDFPGWHLDEIFDFMNKSRPVEVIQVVKLLSREREEKLKAAEEKKREEVEELNDVNKPKIRTRFWKQNENNRRSEEEMKKKAVRKDRKQEFLTRAKQLLGMEFINEDKALKVLTKNGNNGKKTLVEMQQNPEEFRLLLSITKSEN